ncbi:MAG: penicillin-binding protein activator [Deltaproteobacteria bacterium]|nr:penicillin-binding protein activator [Deltaproteobacteria bacterium]
MSAWEKTVCAKPRPRAGLSGGVRSGRFVAALTLVVIPAFLAPLGAGPAHGQSILSRNIPVVEGSPVAETMESQELERWYQADLKELFQEVGRGNGHRVYVPLKARMEDELARAWDEGRDMPALKHEYQAHLIRAAERVVPSEELERMAEGFVETYPDSDFFPLAFYFYNRARFEQGKSLVESFFFDEQALGVLPEWQRRDFLRLQGASAVKKGEFLAAAEHLMAELMLGGANVQTRPEEVMDLLEGSGDIQGVDKFLERHGSVGWLSKKALQIKTRALINSGKYEEALLSLGTLEQEQGDDPETVKFITDSRYDIRERLATRPRRLGVLLPLGSSSRFLRELANEVLDGLRLAVQFVQSREQGRSQAGSREEANRKLGRLRWMDIPVQMDIRQMPENSGSQPKRGFELVVRDTANSPRLTERMLDELVKEEQVVAIIGPIARDESEMAVSLAEDLEVPLISLSVSLELPENPRYAFRHSMSQEDEVDDLVRYAMDYLHVSRFAVLYPQDSYGSFMMNLFWNRVQARGGTVVAASGFSPAYQRNNSSWSVVSFKKIFEEFTGLNRPLEAFDLELQEAVGDSSPDPIVDFDALFIPSGPVGLEDLQLIAPYPVTVDAENVQLLGSRFWNDDSVIVAGDTKLEGAVFVDAFDRTNTNPRVNQFNSLHRSFFGHRGGYRTPTYYTALGYDTALLLMDLAARPGNTSREALALALRSMKPFPGVTGMTSFNERGESEKESMFFQIRNNEIQRLHP